MVAAMPSSLPEDSSSSERPEKVKYKDEASIVETRRRMTRERVQPQPPTRVNTITDRRPQEEATLDRTGSTSSSALSSTTALLTTVAAAAAAAAAEPDPRRQSPTPLSPSRRPSLSDDNTTVVATPNRVLAGASSFAPSSGVAPEGIMEDGSSSSHPDRFLNEGHAVPSTRWERALGFASLGVGMAWGTLRQSVDPTSSSSLLSNEDRLAATLCRMRGAALKLGQMLSIQDESTILPPALAKALQRVRQGADAMPTSQLTAQLRQELGDNWRESYFRSFDDRPLAAASIGQVHHATLRDDDVYGIPRRVVVKVQYPGVAQSIHSDLRNLSMLVKLSGLAPPGLFLDNIIRVGEAELLVECDYRREMEHQLRMQQLVEADAYLRANDCHVPSVVPDLCTSQVYVTEYAPGATIDRLADVAPQDERDRIGRMILYLTMKELFDWRFMQTDPNWGNFLYDVNTKRTSLIDFGAAREYDKNFVDGYLRIVWASAVQDADTLMAQSRKMGFLTGDENAAMLRAHQLSGFTVGEPFCTNEPFDFRASRISERLSEHTAVFLRHRLTPPPAEVYTLHRKLAGAYMLCIKLNAKVYSRDILEEIVANHSFDDGMPNPLS
jgi:aarF domain-containing kinase